jgi:hypothetical protein
MTDGKLVYQLHCPLCDETIDLPHQSPLGTFVNLQCQPTGTWPIAFLCREREQLCQIAANFEGPTTAFVGSAPTSGSLALWLIECRCAHENCDKPLSIYSEHFALATKNTIMDTLSRGLSKCSPPLVCPSTKHEFVLSMDKFWLYRLDS